MHIGMLWYDNDPTAALDVKIQKAAEYYRNKYGRKPNLCLVNPGMLNGEKFREQKITIRPYRFVLPGHLWIGIEDHT